MMDLDKMNQIVADFEKERKEFRARAREVMRSLFKEYFDKYPDLKVLWSQYTPSFNDGEPCEFTIGEIYLTNAPIEDVREHGHHDYEDEFDHVYGMYGDYTGQPYFWGDSWGNLVEENTPKVFHKYAGAEKIRAVIENVSLEEVFEETFGNNVWVLASKDGFEVDEYDCGY